MEKKKIYLRDGYDSQYCFDKCYDQFYFDRDDSLISPSIVHGEEPEKSNSLNFKGDNN